MFEVNRLNRVIKINQNKKNSLILNYFTKEKPTLIWVIDSASDGSDLIKVKGYPRSNCGPWFLEGQQRLDWGGVATLPGRAAARHGRPVEFAGVPPISSYGGWFLARIVPTGS
jgi:hypothetical protein